MDSTPLVTVVCPAFQEETVLPCFHAELAAVLTRLEPAYRFEILYVDDGSADRTLEVMRVLAARDPRVRLLSLSRNFGHQAALTAGLDHAAGDVVITLDSDLQHPPGLINDLLRHWRNGAEVVITVREEDPELGWAKRVTSRWFYRVMRLLSDTEIRPAASDYRLLSRAALDGLLKMGEAHRFLRGMVRWIGFAAAEVRFKPAVRRAGTSKYTVRRMARLALDGVLSFSKVPLRLVFLGGLLTAAWAPVAAGAAAHGLWAADRTEFAVGLILAAVVGVGGATLCGLGVVGEYVGQVLDEVRRRPLYLIKEASPELRDGHHRHHHQPHHHHRDHRVGPRLFSGAGPGFASSTPREAFDPFRGAA